MTARPYQYRAHGLTFHSDLELPELAPCEGPPDVVIRLGAIPDHPGGASHGDYEVVDGNYLLTLPGIADYWVSGGREVVVAPCPKADVSEIRMPLLSSVMAALAHQRGALVLHAGAVEIDGSCVVVAGRSGSGKSTLVAALHARGNGMVSDDISLVSFDNGGRPFVNHGPRHVKLWPDALDRVAPALGTGQPLRDGVAKLTVAVTADPSATALPLVRMFVLARSAGDAMALEVLEGRAKMAALMRETYRRRMRHALGRSRDHFDQCATLARWLPIVRLKRPRNLDGLGALAHAVEDHVRACEGGRT